MIQINDFDLPITAAEKIITGTKPNPMKGSLMAKAMESTMGVSMDAVDMFSVEEVKEIAVYLMTYCMAHKGDD